MILLNVSNSINRDKTGTVIPLKEDLWFWNIVKSLMMLSTLSALKKN